MTRIHRIILVIAGLQVVLALIALASWALRGIPLLAAVAEDTPPGMRATQLIIFGLVGLTLYSARDRDHRAEWLGGCLLLIASSYAYGVLSALSQPQDLAFRLGATAINFVPADAFLPWFFWHFAKTFPDTIRRSRIQRIIEVGLRIVPAICIALLGFSLATKAGLEVAGLPFIVDRDDDSNAYWVVVYGLVLMSLVLLLLKGRRVHSGDRDRYRIFLGGFVAGAGPSCVFIVVVGVMGAAGDQVLRTSLGSGIVLALQVTHLFVPLLCGYAVWARETLDVRSLYRGGWIYWPVVAVSYTLPLLLVLLTLERLVSWRDETIYRVAIGEHALVLWSFVGLTALSFWAMRRTRRIAQRFSGRLPVDAPAAMDRFIRRSSTARTAEQLWQVTRRVLSESSSIGHCSIFLLHGGRFLDVEGQLPPLERDTAMARELFQHPFGSEPDVHQLEEADQRWLLDTNTTFLLLTLHSATTRCVLLALGSKRGELPWTDAERRLLRYVADHLAAHDLLSELHPPEPPGRAMECDGCASVTSQDHSACPDCGGDLTIAPVPHVLREQFRFERRIGEGSRGVVYLAEDVALARHVAVKTLPSASPADAKKLRVEAGQVARIAHPNVATIHAVESWGGTPMLVFELLEGGTLADRLLGSPLPREDALRVATEIASGLSAAHQRGVVHGDLKPDNVGFDASGQAKLLDFGLTAAVTEVDSLDTLSLEDVTLSRFLANGDVGTPLYLPPEAYFGARKDRPFDLWATSVILYECLTGRHPFLRPTWPETLAGLHRGFEPDAEPQLPGDLADLFTRLLHTEVSQRPQSADELRGRLQLAARRGAGSPPPARLQ